MTLIPLWNRTFQAISGHILETVRDRAKYYESLIGNGIHPFRWHKYHRPWITFRIGDSQYGRTLHLGFSFISMLSASVTKILSLKGKFNNENKQ